MYKRIPLMLALVLGVATATSAQFAGDVYFDEPSVAIAEGEAGQLEVVVFAGDRPLGAAHVEITYDPEQLEIAAIEPGSAKELDESFVSTVEAGQLAFIALNDTSLTDPFGTVSLATIKVRPLGAAGTRTSLDITVRDLLDQRSDSFTNVAGFSGEVVVTAGAGASINGFSVQSLTVPKRVSAAERSALKQRAARMARPGQTVTVLHTPSGSSTAIPMTVTVQPIPSEETPPTP